MSSFVQHYSSSPGSIAIANEPGENFVFNLPNPTLAGNGLICVVGYPSGSTPAITDDKSNSWPTSGTSGTTLTADAGAGNMALQAFLLSSATTGTQQVKVGFGGNPQIPVRVWITEVPYTLGSIQNSNKATAVNASGVVSPGAFTPSVANCLVLSYMCDSNTVGTTNPTLITAASGFALNDADISFTTGNGSPAASQWQLQTTAVSATGSFTLTGSGTETYNVLEFAVSTATAGTQKPATGIHIDRRLYFCTDSCPASYKLQIPSTGNLLVLETPVDNAGTGIISTTDSDSVPWVNKGTAGTPLFTYRANSTPSATRTVTCTFTATGVDQMFRFDDISGADPSPFDTVVSSSSSINNTNAISNFPTITPATANGLILVSFQNGLGPTLGCTAPANAIYGEPNYSRAQFTGGITLTTLTVTATAWGTVANGLEAISGGTTVTGTTIQSGAGPTYTIQPSQTVSPGTTMTQASQDSSTVNWGNGSAHYYNPNTSAVSFAWSFANQPSNSCTATAISFKAAPPPSSPTLMGGMCL